MPATKPDQTEVIKFLSDSRTYSLPKESVQKIETHGAVVFLVGDRAYKLKRAVRFDYMDFSTPDKRKHFCEAEIQINARTAPSVYLGTRAIIRCESGALALVEPQKVPKDCEVLDWVVEMVRFDQSSLFDRMADEGTLTKDTMASLADQIAEFHSRAEIRNDMGGYAAHQKVIKTNQDQFLQYVGKIFDPETVDLVTTEAYAELEICSEEIDRRRTSGLVRHCHGDMHLQNIFLWQGVPTLFDAIEFDDQIACVDVLYDLAFLIMDLNERHMGAFANLVLNRYLLRTAVPDTWQLQGLKCLPLFLSCRAGVRAHVSAATAVSHSDQSRRAHFEKNAQSYLASASRYLKTEPPKVIAIGGLSGTGKSTLAESIVPYLGRAPGAIWIRSDVIRKQLMGADLLQKLGPDSYLSEVNDRVYETMIKMTVLSLKAGQSVVIDAVFAKEIERTQLETEVRNMGIFLLGLWLETSEEKMVDRIVARSNDPSDASPDILRSQMHYDLGYMKWVRVDASGTAEETQKFVQKEFLTKGWQDLTDT